MYAAPRRAGRTAATGAARLVAHCAALERAAADPAGLARARLEVVLGPELAGRLVHALTGDRRREAA